MYDLSTGEVVIIIVCLIIVCVIALAVTIACIVSRTVEKAIANDQEKRRDEEAKREKEKQQSGASVPGDKADNEGGQEDTETPDGSRRNVEAIMF